MEVVYGLRAHPTRQRTIRCQFARSTHRDAHGGVIERAARLSAQRLVCQREVLAWSGASCQPTADTTQGAQHALSVSCSKYVIMAAEATIEHRMVTHRLRVNGSDHLKRRSDSFSVV